MDICCVCVCLFFGPPVSQRTRLCIGQATVVARSLLIVVVGTPARRGRGRRRWDAAGGAGRSKTASRRPFGSTPGSWNGRNAHRGTAVQPRLACRSGGGHFNTSSRDGGSRGWISHCPARSWSPSDLVVAGRPGPARQSAGVFGESNLWPCATEVIGGRVCVMCRIWW